MARRTITLDDFIYRELQKLRAAFIRGEGPDEPGMDEMSLTTAVNLVLLGGLIATDRFTDEDWQTLFDYLGQRGPALELDSFTDRRADAYLMGLVERGSKSDDEQAKQE